MSETFFCPDGPGPESPFVAPLNGEAAWRTHPDGSRTCSYCGSLHPDDFVEIMEQYAAGVPGYRFSTTTKSYKAYGNRPGVANASEGDIKFYAAHMPEDRAKFDAAWAAAREQFIKRLGIG